MVNPKEVSSITDNPYSVSEAPSSESEVTSNKNKKRRIIYPPAVGTMGTPAFETRSDLFKELDENTVFMMGDNPALPKMPERPTLADFFRYRLHPRNVSHLLQSANLAQKAGLDEKVVLACLLHDIANGGLIGSDHGYWGAQLIGPYVDEEVSWAVRYHQALRFFPDPAVDYEYPESYLHYFGPDYTPPPYIQEAYQYARQHRWYMTARLVTLNDLYSFDPNVKVEFEQFEDIVGRHFKQPKEGLGFDGSPVAHMWRTIIWPNNFL
jgi:hypothetical protein